MIRKIHKQDEADFLQLCKEFYTSDAVLHPVPESYHKATFDELMRSQDYAEGYLFEVEGKTAGYALLSKTFSQEVGGLVVWLEELYIRNAFQGKGLGSAFLAYLEENRPTQVKRFRLEVEPDNTGAVSLYKRKGYEVLGYMQMVKEFTE